eukprot:332773-Hanusia_phi.AAC.1
MILITVPGQDSGPRCHRDRRAAAAGSDLYDAAKPSSLGLDIDGGRAAPKFQKLTCQRDPG